MFGAVVSAPQSTWPLDCRGHDPTPQTRPGAWKAAGRVERLPGGRGDANVTLSHRVCGDASDQPPENLPGRHHKVVSQLLAPAGIRPHVAPRAQPPLAAVCSGLHAPAEGLGGPGLKPQGSPLALQPGVIGMVSVPVTDGDTDTQRG